MLLPQQKYPSVFSELTHFIKTNPGIDACDVLLAVSCEFVEKL